MNIQFQRIYRKVATKLYGRHVLLHSNRTDDDPAGFGLYENNNNNNVVVGWVITIRGIHGLLTG